MNKIEFGDCRDTMRRWAAEGVKAQTCVTSPPYFGLRDYGHDGQIGLEQTPEQYIAAMVEVFRCVKDVLADDGTLWLNIGDSYYNTNPGSGGKCVLPGAGRAMREARYHNAKRDFSGTDLKPKDLIGIPWMLAFALRADGWYLRQDIIWHKPNPMPESVTDRCTKAHEYLFLLTKSPRYYFDSEAIKEPAIHSGRIVKATGSESKNANAGFGSDTKKGFTERDILVSEKRNRRSVWTVNTRPFAEAHFATFPPDLVLPMVLAGSREGDTVLDPFNGAGTTGLVAIQQGRQYVGCELNPEYVAMSERRLGAVTPLFQEVSA